MRHKTLFKIILGNEGNFYATNYESNPKTPVKTAMGWFKSGHAHRIGEMLINNKFEVIVIKTALETEIETLFAKCVKTDKNCLNVRTHMVFEKTWNRRNISLRKKNHFDKLLVASMKNEFGKITYIDRKTGRNMGLSNYMNENSGYPLNKDLCEYRGEINII